MFLDRFRNQLLSRIGTHIPIVCSKCYTWKLGGLLGDAFDVYAFTLLIDHRVAVETSDEQGTCNGDTRLYRIDPAVLDSAGRAGAILAALASDDSSGVGECSRIEEDLLAGTHYYLVEEDGDDYRLSYTFRAVPVFGAGELCDPGRVESYCEGGRSCDDPDLDGDGSCSP